MLPDDASYLSLSGPFAHPWHFAGLELVFTACFGATVLHALRRYRAGDRYPAFQWLVIFAYGVAMELIAFNAFKNYEHGQFTVQLYHRKLPLYVTFVYVAFHYTGIKLVERWRLGRVAEALLAGLAICLLDVPFDITGVDARWWWWVASDRDVAQRWLGVPLTSYYWYLLFGAILAALCRAVRPRLERRSLLVYATVAPVVAVGVIVLGVVGFLPFHALEAVGVPDAAIVAAHVAGCVVLAWRGLRGRAEAIMPPIAFVPGALYVWHAAVLAALARGGVVGDVAIKGATIAGAAAALALVGFGAPRRVERNFARQTS